MSTIVQLFQSNPCVDACCCCCTLSPATRRQLVFYTGIMLSTVAESVQNLGTGMKTPVSTVNIAGLQQGLLYKRCRQLAVERKHVWYPV